MATYIIGGIVLGAFALAVYSIYKDKKSGKSCAGGCSGCNKACSAPLKIEKNK